VLAAQTREPFAFGRPFDVTVDPARLTAGLRR